MNLCVLMRSEMMEISKQHDATVVCNASEQSFIQK
jgi:hypothetical protein